jgi:hypothetical protein
MGGGGVGPLRPRHCWQVEAARRCALRNAARVPGFSEQSSVQLMQSFLEGGAGRDGRETIPRFARDEASTDLVDTDRIMQ